MGFEKTEKNLEIIFIVVFSVLVFALFYSLLDSNGLIIGNDPAIHLQRAKFFLDVGRVPLSDIAWYPPLYHLLLSTFMVFTGATSVEQTLILMKVVTALIDWLLVFSVYLVAAKFFGKTTGVFASMLLLLCFPLYEINSWGGYTSIIALAFMLLAFLYLALPLKSFGSSLMAFLFAFSVVMSHQLATFLAVFILPPFIIVVLVKSRGHYPKALIAALLGGGIAFGIYYLGPILPYLGDLVYIIFFQLKIYQFQIPFVSFSSFTMYFGFILYFAFAGLVVAFFELKKRKSLSFYLLLALAFIVPLFLSQSYLVGIYLPYQWFIYYMSPTAAIFAAVTLSFLIDKIFAAYFNNRSNWKRTALKVISIGVVVAMVVVMAVRFDTVSGKIEESAEFYSVSDMSAYQAGRWVRDNSDASSKVVVAESPGHWFGVYSGRDLIAETDPVIEWNVVAESVLDLSYDIENPLTMIRGYFARGNSSDDVYVATNMVWKRVAFFPENDSYISYRDADDVPRVFALSSLERTMVLDATTFPLKIKMEYSAEAFSLIKTILLRNDTYPVSVTWQLTALGQDLNFASLFLSEYFDPNFSFDKAYVSGVLDWTSPWTNASRYEANNWAVSEFTSNNLAADNCIDVYDSTNGVAFGLCFIDLPAQGNIGSLSDGYIDAVRFQYNFNKIDVNHGLVVEYKMLAFGENSYPELQNYAEMNTLFDFTVEQPLDLKSRDFASLIQDNDIVFLVYNKQRFDNSLLSSKLLELVYSNDKYVVLKITIGSLVPILE